MCFYDFLIDIDECLSNPCDDICTNTNGSFACSCSSGSIDPSNMTSCLNRKLILIYMQGLDL